MEDTTIIKKAGAKVGIHHTCKDIKMKGTFQTRAQICTCN